jgi:hypothetical protein
MSIQAFFLRTLLRLRKAGMNWDAPVEHFRANLRLSDRFVKLPRFVPFLPEAQQALNAIGAFIRERLHL